MAKFKVLHGLHCEGTRKDGSQRVYKKGEVVNSKTDLSRFNPPGMPPKFEKVHGHTEAVDEPQDDLVGKTVDQLRTQAAVEKIDLGEATKRGEIVEIIRAARAAKSD